MSTRIFYIDDDSDDIQLVEEILTAMGESSCIFQHVSDLMQLLDNPPPSPSIIFIDLNMPKINGLEVLDKVRSREKFDDIPVVMLSTNAPPDKVAECREHGANLFMIKAYTMTTVRNSFQHVLDIDWNTFKPVGKEFIYAA